MSLATDNTWVRTSVYVAYFFGIVFLSIVLDRLGTFDAFMARLGQSAHRAFMKYEYVKRKESATPHDNYLEHMDEPMEGGCCSLAVHKVAADLANNGANDDNEEDDSEGSEDADSEHELPVSSQCLRCIFIWFYGRPHIESAYNLFFVRKLLTNATYWGCEEGVVSLFGDARPIVSDFVYCVCNNHSFLAIFCATKRGKYARPDRRRAFIVQNCVTFFLECMVNDSIARGDGRTSPFVSRLLFNVFLVTPVSLIVNHSYHYLLTCPCLSRHFDWCFCQFLADCGYCVGRTLSFPVLVAMLYLLYAASTFTARDEFGTMLQYVYQVHLMSILTDLLWLSLAFRYDRYTAYEVAGFTVFSFGSWFKEQVEIFDLKEGKHYIVVERGWPWLRRVQWFRRAGVVRPRPEGDKSDLEAGLHGRGHGHHHHTSFRHSAHVHHAHTPSPSPSLDGNNTSKGDELSGASPTIGTSGSGHDSGGQPINYYQKRMSAISKATTPGGSRPTSSGIPDGRGSVTMGFVPPRSASTTPPPPR